MIHLWGLLLYTLVAVIMKGSRALVARNRVWKKFRKRKRVMPATRPLKPLGYKLGVTLPMATKTLRKINNFYLIFDSHHRPPLVVIFQ